MFSPGEHYLSMTEGCLATAEAACLNNLIFTINFVPLWTKICMAGVRCLPCLLFMPFLLCLTPPKIYFNTREGTGSFSTTVSKNLMRMKKN